MERDMITADMESFKSQKSIKRNREGHGKQLCVDVVEEGGVPAYQKFVLLKGRKRTPLPFAASLKETKPTNPGHVTAVHTRVRNGGKRKIGGLVDGETAYPKNFFKKRESKG